MKLEDLIMTKRETIEHLKAFALKSKDPKLVMAIMTAIDEVGRCQDCNGTGTIWKLDKPVNNYKREIRKNGQYKFGVPCSCINGKRLSVACNSCGDIKDVMPRQRHLALCDSCEQRYIKEDKFLN